MRKNRAVVQEYGGRSTAPTESSGPGRRSVQRHANDVPQTCQGARVQLSIE